jgi:multisubunit Na+/H+ antiporter MnhG subunit
MIDITLKNAAGFLPKHITRDQAKDTGMAMVLICLLIGYFSHKPGFIGAAILLLLVAMTWPTLYKPAGKLWFGLSHVLGTVMSKIILSILFFLLVTPVGLMRRLSGHDSLQLRTWKQSRSSVFKVRNHVFTSQDIQHPY